MSFLRAVRNGPQTFVAASSIMQLSSLVLNLGLNQTVHAWLRALFFVNPPWQCLLLIIVDFSRFYLLVVKQTANRWILFAKCLLSCMIMGRRTNFLEFWGSGEFS